MQLAMGSGRRAYKLTYGQQARLKDVVDIFDYDRELNFVSISKQTDYYEKWLDSLKG
jgi:hypothetical protein